MAIKKDYITDFDSSTSMLFALAHYLHGKEFRGLAIAPPPFDVFSTVLNWLPKPLRLALYRWSGWLCAVPEKKAEKVDHEEIGEWIVSQYPRRKYPAIMIGSSNGAAVHLCAALGIPWIPQTVLLSVRRSLHPDDVELDAEYGKKIAQRVLRNNPDLAVYQMHDPLQDRLMVARMSYYRLKMLKMGRNIENFIKECLEPGGTIISLECQYKWPVYNISPGHSFQIGGFGGLTGEEYMSGGPQVSEFMKFKNGKRESWTLPGTPELKAEAEWGFVDNLYGDCIRFAAAQGYQVRRMQFEMPEDLSPFVADLYQSWYQKHGLPAKRLVSENFALIEPYWMIKTGSVPFWLAFNTKCSYESLEKYLDRSSSWDEIYAMLMSNGVEKAIGLVMPDGWRKLLKRARRKSDFLGVNEKRYPVDFATFTMYHRHFTGKVKDRYPHPPRLTLKEMDVFCENELPTCRLQMQDGNLIAAAS